MYNHNGARGALGELAVLLAEEEYSREEDSVTRDARCVPAQDRTPNQGNATLSSVVRGARGLLGALVQPPAAPASPQEPEHAAVDLDAPANRMNNSTVLFKRRVHVQRASQ